MTGATEIERRGSAERSTPATADHPFAAFLRILGRGPTLSRPLDEGEAEAAMGMVLADAVEPEQLGAFLLLQRYRGETADELAGFVRAARRVLPPRPAGLADLDWPSYADRHKQLPYFLLAALMLAEAGVRVAMHGLAGQGPATVPGTLAVLGIAPAVSPAAAAARLETQGFAYLPIETLCPPLSRLFGLRRILGLRSPVNSFARELNPLGAPAQIQGVFHPAYLPLHQAASRKLGQPRAAIFKGGGGEAQRNPEKPCRVATLAGDQAGEELWPALTPELRFPWREEPLEPAAVAALWRGERAAEGPEAAVVGTAAIALTVLGRAGTQANALAMAAELWRGRPRRKYG